MSETGGELILPMSFIPVAERYDLMRTIDRWVIERAFARLPAPRAGPRRPERPRSSRSTSRGTRSPARNSATSCATASRSSACRRSASCFEITETAAIANVERARAAIEGLREMGVRFWLDDFGSGLSSFNYLKHFPVDGLKIDGLFVKGMARNYLDYALVEAIQKIAETMGLATIAEYVESEEIATQARGDRRALGAGLPPRRAAAPWRRRFPESGGPSAP